MSETTVIRDQTRELASFLAGLRYEDLPDDVVERTKDFFLDWAASALAGRGSRPVDALASFAGAMGPDDGPCEILPSRRRTSPFFAALVNAASSHVVEQDDVHNASVFHPSTVVFRKVPAGFGITPRKTPTGSRAVARTPLAHRRPPVLFRLGLAGRASGGSSVWRNSGVGARGSRRSPAHL